MVKNATPKAAAPKNTFSIGTNITATVDGNKLILVMDMDTRIGPSASGKTTIIATSSGNAEIPGSGGVKLGLNLYVPVSK